MTFAAGGERSHPGTGCGCTAPSERKGSALNCRATGRGLGKFSTECPRWCTACGCRGWAPGVVWWYCTRTDSRRTAPLPRWLLAKAAELLVTPRQAPLPTLRTGPQALQSQLQAPPPRGVRRPNRRRRAPGHLKDYVTGDGVVGDD